jgi:two-component system cell cycle sensor histidine kinase/response regulator CckA
LSRPPQQAPLERLGEDVLGSLLEGCQVIGFEFTYLYVNDAIVAQGQRAREDLIGRTMMECYPGIEGTEMFAALRRCMEGRAYDRMENEFTFPDGSKGWFELRFVPVPAGVCILSLDVTDVKRAAAALAHSEEQLRHAQKMEAVGRLAGGVAHDFNNILSVILSYAEMMQNDLEPGSPFRADLDEMRRAGQRGSELTRQLLTFSRVKQAQRRVVHLNHEIGAMEPMLRRLIGADVTLTMLPGAGLGKVVADPGQLEQVVMNFVVNARDAMPGGGKLTLETRNVDLDAEYAATHLGVVPGPYVMLAVSDTGMGMDKDTQARIFEPFFTTKEPGKGTGLGLATTFGIVRQHEGHIWVYSEPGKGTTFKVYFPRTEADVIAEPSQPPVEPAGTGNETILLVEDDPQVRTLAVTILRRGGYRVLEASNAGEAILVCDDHPATIHLLLTDVVLPRMSGRALAERLLTSRPSMRVLFMSGYSDEAVQQHGVVDSTAAYLEKPLTPEKLRRKVREVLGEP